MNPWLDDIWNSVANTSAGLDPNGLPLSGPQPPPVPQTPNGTTINSNPLSTAVALAAAHRAANAPVSPAIMKQVNSPMDFTQTPGLGYGGSANSDPNKPIAYTPPQPSVIPPTATAQVPQNQPMPPPRPGAPQAPPQQQQSYGSPWDPQGAGYAAAQRLAQQQQGSPWDPQGAGYAAAQRLAQRAPVQGPLAALGQQQNSPFTMVLRPNAPAESGGRGQGGSPLSTALDLSGYQPPPPAPPSYNLGYGGGGRGGGGGGGAPAPSRMRAQAPQDPGSAFWSTSGPGVGLPANKGPGFWAIHGPGVGLPANNGPGFWAIHGPGVGMPSPGPVNQPGFWGVHGRGVGFSGNQ